jgi:glycerol kinase
MSQKFVLALDLGTTGNRAIVFDRDQRIVCRFYEEFPQIYPRPGWVEHDPAAIWESVRSILKRTFRKISPEKITSLGIANQRETIVLWDKKTGRPIHNAIVWQCRRSTSLCESLKKKGLEDLIHQRTGLFLDPYFSATKLTWIFRNVKRARPLAQNGRLLAGTIDTWIIWKLSGGRLHITDTSNASRTMLLNIHTKEWDAKLCKIFEVPKTILPKVAASSAVAGSTDEKLFGCKIPIAGIVGDQQAASFAQGCFSPGILKNTYGTGLFLMENIGKKPRFSKNLITTIAWSLGNVDETEYALEGSVFIAGAALQWLRDGLKIIKHAQDSEKMALGLSSNEGVYFVPALAGLGAPYWDPRARGLISGITRGTTSAHLARAALEAIAYQTRDLFEVMKKDVRTGFKPAPTSLRVDGGASANDFLMQFQADVLGIPVERPRILETTALGAAGLAGLAVGFWKDKREFDCLRQKDRVFYPKMRNSEREKLYQRWLEAVKACQRFA